MTNVTIPNMLNVINLSKCVEKNQIDTRYAIGVNNGWFWSNAAIIWAPATLIARLK